MLTVALALGVAEEQKATNDQKVEETEQKNVEADAPAEKNHEKRGIHETGDWHHPVPHHPIKEEKTLTIVKKIPVPYPKYKTVHVPHVKEVHVPVHVKVPKPYPVYKHVSKI